MKFPFQLPEKGRNIMKRIDRILKFTLTGSYINARKVADDIVVSLIKNKDVESSPETFASSVTLSPLGRLVKFLKKGSKPGVYDWDSHKLCYVIEIYKTYGNRKSKLFVICNDDLKQVVVQ